MRPTPSPNLPCREPTYFQSMRNVANTMLSFREQSVWVEVLKVGAGPPRDLRVPAAARPGA